MKKILFGLVAILLISVGVQAWQNQPAGTQAIPATKVKQDVTGVSEDFKIGLEDVIAVNVWREPELSTQSVVVRPDGKISLPLIDEIRATGLTTKQLQDLITEKLKEFVAAPNVTVTVTQINSRKVSVVGQVGSPGAYPIGGPTTVLDLLARAGGFGEYAKTKDIKIIRKEGSSTTVFRFNFKDVSGGKNLDQNIYLKSGDIIIVP